MAKQQMYVEGINSLPQFMFSRGFIKKKKKTFKAIKWHLFVYSEHIEEIFCVKYWS